MYTPDEEPDSRIVRMNIPAKDKELIEEYMMPYGQLLITRVRVNDYVRIEIFGYLQLATHAASKPR